MESLRLDSSRARHIYRYYIVELDGKALVVGLDSRLELELELIVEIGDDLELPMDGSWAERLGECLPRRAST